MAKRMTRADWARRPDDRNDPDGRPGVVSREGGCGGWYPAAVILPTETIEQCALRHAQLQEQIDPMDVVYD